MNSVVTLKLKHVQYLAFPKLEVDKSKEAVFDMIQLTLREI